MAVDSEINVSTDTPAEVSALRRKVWTAHTAGDFAGGSASPQEIAETFRDWQKLMRKNDGNKKAGLPLHGFLCSLADYKFSYTRSF